MADVDIDAALRYPLSGEHGTKTLLLGGGLPVLLSIAGMAVGLLGLAFPPVYLLFLPLGVVQLAVTVVWIGYFLRVGRRTFAGRTEPPGLGEWGDLVGDGARGFLVTLAYQVPMVVMSVVGFGLVFLTIAGAGSLSERGVEAAGAGVGVLGVLLFLLVMLVTFAYSLVASYVLPAALLAYADQGRLGAAFSVDRLKTVTYSEAYAVPWLVAAGLYVGVVGVVSFLSSILIGYLLVPFLPVFYFYLGTAAFYMLGQAYAERTGMAVPETEADDRRAAPTGGDRGPEDI